MNIDFTYKTYSLLLNAFINADYKFIPVSEYITSNNIEEKKVVLRHDIDKYPRNALKIALIEKSLNIRSTYYFRCLPCSYNENIIAEISALGHEIGYHYEDLSIMKGNKEKAIVHFILFLEKMRKIVPVKTICMHGSPLSKYDNKELWKSYNYKSYDLISEPYFDFDFNKIFYISDTGRGWNKTNYTIRDKVESSFSLTFKDSFQIIRMIEEDKMPHIIHVNTHPQRWFDFGFCWIKEYIYQTIKNGIKQILIYARTN